MTQRKQEGISYPFTITVASLRVRRAGTAHRQKTMEIHHGKHHAAYVNNLNKALESAAGPGRARPWRNCWPTTAPSFRRTSAPRFATTAAATSTTPCSGRSWRPDAGGSARRQRGPGHHRHLRRLRRVQGEVQPGGATRFGSGWAWLLKSDGSWKSRPPPTRTAR